MKEAKKIDLETIYTIAQEGLTELRKHDERFAAFQDSLFSQDSKKTNRESCTKDYNKQLDETISQFLKLLSPFFLLNPAHKTLEYLIRHYMYVFSHIFLFVRLLFLYFLLLTQMQHLPLQCR